MMTDWDEFIETFAYWTHWKPAKPQAIDEADKARTALRSAIAELEQVRWIPVGERLPEIGQGVIGRHELCEPCYVTYSGHNTWYLNEYAAEEWDINKPTHWMALPAAIADYDKQLQIETLKAQLAEAEADADRLAKELHDWLVFAEANDQIYAARSGMNAMLHHQKRKEDK